MSHVFEVSCRLRDSNDSAHRELEVISLGLQVTSKKAFGVGLEGPNTF